MNITGRVVFNCRGMMLHGYPCFVNMAPSVKTKQMICSGSHHQGSPFSGFPQILSVDSNNIKISPYSFYSSNYSAPTIGISNLTTNEYLTKTYTACAWIKGIPFVPASTLGVPSEYGQTMISLLYTNGNAKYNQYNKYVSIHDTINGWQEQRLNINFMDNDWHYWAITSENAQMRIFLDGVKIFDKNINGATPTQLSVWFRSNGQHKYIDDIVVILDQALWTNNFTPPTDYLLGNEYTMEKSEVKRNNLISSTVAPNIVFPYDDILKIY